MRTLHDLLADLADRHAVARTACRAAEPPRSTLHHGANLVPDHAHLAHRDPAVIGLLVELVENAERFAAETAPAADDHG